jgi:phosphohistidine phosphatase
MLEEELYAASCDESLARIRPVPDAVASVMLIGDNPRLQQLARVLASAGAGLERLNEKFPRAALATLAVANSWGDWARRTRARGIRRSEAASLSAVSA